MLIPVRKYALSATPRQVEAYCMNSISIHMYANNNTDPSLCLFSLLILMTLTLTSTLHTDHITVFRYNLSMAE
jgi:hypothetical protein